MLELVNELHSQARLLSVLLSTTGSDELNLVDLIVVASSIRVVD